VSYFFAHPVELHGMAVLTCAGIQLGSECSFSVDRSERTAVS